MDSHLPPPANLRLTPPRCAPAPCRIPAGGRFVIAAER